MRFLTSFALALVLAASTTVASAQVYSVYSPIAGYTPAVTDYGYGPAYSPTVTYYAGSAVGGPVAAVPTTSFYAPAVVPTTTYYAPTAAVVPTTTYYAPAGRANDGLLRSRCRSGDDLLRSDRCARRCLLRCSARMGESEGLRRGRARSQLLSRDHSVSKRPS